MAMVNRSIVVSRLGFIEDALKEMQSLGGTDKEGFLRNKTAVAAVESYLRRSLEALFDIARHLLVHQGWHEYSLEYKSLAKGMAAKGIVTAEMEKPLLEMAGYRNRLVHFYHEVKAEELFEIIQRDIRHLEQVVKQIRQYTAQL
jgi:uncharacterized protein YutE (UPF0331/DUF86 family)